MAEVLDGHGDLGPVVEYRPRVATAPPFVRTTVAACVLLTMPGCKGPIVGPHAVWRTRERDREPSREHIARTMVEQDVYLVASSSKHEVLVRRCLSEGDRDDCEVAWVVGGRVIESYPATSSRASLPTALVHSLAEPIEARIKTVAGRVLNIREREVRVGELYGPESSLYRFELDDDHLRIIHRTEPNSEWGTEVAALRVPNAAETLNGYITHDEYGLFALQFRHESNGVSSTSWLVFERDETGPGGGLWVIESRTGERATVVSATPHRVRLSRPQPVPPPQSPAPTPQIAIDEQAEPPPARPCEDVSDCAEGESCRSPEARSWNHCGRQVQPHCPDGHVADGCGHCFAACQTDVDCSAQTHCNGAYCESQTVCAIDEPPPP